MPDGAERSSFVDFVRIVMRRKWLIVVCVLVAPAVSYWHEHGQKPVYSSTSQVLLTPQNPALSYAGLTTGSSSSASDPQRYASTQIFLARSPDVANRVVAVAHQPGLTADVVLAHSSVSAPADTNLLAFTATGRNPANTQRLANLYAQAYTAYRRQKDTQGIESAIRELQKSLSSTAASDTTVRAQLLDRITTLQTTEALQREGTFVARPAAFGHQIAPHPKRSLFLGLGIGLVLGIGLALLRETADTRVRLADDIAERLGLPLLGQLPALDSRARAERRLVMLDEPFGTSAEMFRMLRTSIDLANLDRHAQALMVTSANEGEGKTTVACNLAIAFAGAGRRVILLDLDLRRPSTHAMLGISSRPGLTDVALGQAQLGDALVRITLEDDHSGGSFLVLPAGPMPPNPGEFAGTSSVGAVIEELRTLADLVIVDTPPVLQVAEAMTVSSRVDAMLVVVDITRARKAPLAELRRQLDRSPANKLGVVAVGSREQAVAQYEHYAPYAYPADDLVS